MAGTSKKESWTTHDGACTSCRTRKIRCGREKPMCGCCRRDQTECIYASPPKRVNHVKVLCQGFDDIQDRLITMQGELSWLTETLKRSNISERQESESQKTPRSGSPSCSSSSDDAHISSARTTAGHTVRDGETQIERHYGPWTLVAQCRDFGTDLTPIVDSSEEGFVGGLVNRMIIDTTKSDDDDLDFDSKAGQQDCSISLPPRRILSATLDTFLKQTDYSTDIFCHSTLYEAMERVYKEPSGPTSEAWTLCFNLIILLTLGAERPVHSGDPFVRPMLQEAHAIVGKTSFFMTPRLVNIQGLALYSLLAQQYHTGSETFGNFIFSRACILARESGLHQASNDLSSLSTLSAVEVEARQKVFRSLYIRERYSATACGALTWLPSGGFKGQPANTSNVDTSRTVQTQHSPQWELVKLQDELYHLLSSVDAPEISTSERRISLTQLQQKLEIWAQRHKIPSSNRPSTADEISLRLAFFGTRMRLMLEDQHNSTDAQPLSEEILNDARLSCLLLVTSYNHLDRGILADRLDHLLMKTADPSSRTAGTSSSSTSPLQTPGPSPLSATFGVQLQSSSPYLPLSTQSRVQTPVLPLPPIHRLANIFPIAAVFVLSRHILGIGLSAQSSQLAPNAERQQEINGDFLLLKALLSRFRSELPTVKVSPREKMDDVFHRSKLGRITNHLVEIINAIKGPTSPNYPHDANRDVDNQSLYAPEPLIASKSSLLLDYSSDASMPDLNFYDGSGDLSPSQLDMPLTPFSSQSTWAVTQELMPFSTTPLLTAANSSYAPSLIPTPPTIAETPFDISQFLHQTNSNSPIIWDNGQGRAHVELQQQQQQQQQKKPQPVPDPTTKRKSRKRPRTEGNPV